VKKSWIAFLIAFGLATFLIINFFLPRINEYVPNHMPVVALIISLIIGVLCELTGERYKFEVIGITIICGVFFGLSILAICLYGYLTALYLATLVDKKWRMRYYLSHYPNR